MKKLTVLLCLLGTGSLFLSVGCVHPVTSNFIANPETRSAKFTVERDFDSAYKRAVETFAALGGGITSQDARAGTVAANVHNAVSMTVTLNRVADTGHKTAHIVVKHYFQPGQEEFRKILSHKLPTLLGGGPVKEKTLSSSEMLQKLQSMTLDNWLKVRDELVETMNGNIGGT